MTNIPEKDDIETFIEKRYHTMIEKISEGYDKDGDAERCKRRLMRIGCTEREANIQIAEWNSCIPANDGSDPCHG